MATTIDRRASPAATTGAARHRRQVLTAILGLAVVVGVGVLVVDTVFSTPTVTVVGDSISALSRAATAASLRRAGYRPVIDAVPGAKIGQAQALITRLAPQQRGDWIIELGSDDAGAHNPAWTTPFAAEWSQLSSSRCVIYVSVSPRLGSVAAAINVAIAGLAQSHANVHVLDWGTIEYSHPGWVEADSVHPTPAGRGELASLEVKALRAHC